VRQGYVVTTCFRESRRELLDSRRTFSATAVRIMSTYRGSRGRCSLATAGDAFIQNDHHSRCLLWSFKSGELQQITLHAIDVTADMWVPNAKALDLDHRLDRFQNIIFIVPERSLDAMYRHVGSFSTGLRVESYLGVNRIW